MILVVGLTVLGNGHAVNHRNMEIVTNKIINYNKHINKKVMQSRYRPGVSQRVPGS
jgi:hypothetical protein